MPSFHLYHSDLTFGATSPWSLEKNRISRSTGTAEAGRLHTKFEPDNSAGFFLEFGLTYINGPNFYFRSHSLLPLFIKKTILVTSYVLSEWVLSDCSGFLKCHHYQSDQNLWICFSTKPKMSRQFITFALILAFVALAHGQKVNFTDCGK